MKRTPYFYVLAILCHASTDLIDRAKGLDIDSNVRASVEACVIHAWMLDLWDVTNEDSQAWSTQTFKNLVAFVERDRQVMRSETNQQVSNSIHTANASYLYQFHVSDNADNCFKSKTLSAIRAAPCN